MKWRGWEEQVSLSDSAYELLPDWPDVSRLAHGRLVEFPEYRPGMALSGRPEHYPAEVQVVVNEWGADTDYLHADGPPIVSRRVAERLEATGLEGVRFVPVTLISRKTGKALGSASHALVHVEDHKDYFDWDASSYKRRRTNPNKVIAKRIVLRAPVGGFPALFRLAALPVPLYVNGETREALLSMDLDGIRFGEPARVSTSC